MKRNSRTHRIIALMLASVFLLTSLAAPAAQAGMIGTEAFAGSEQVESQRQAILDMFEREEVRDRLVSWGVNPEDAEQRVQGLTADEVRDMHARMGDMPAGADAGGIVGAAVLIFLVLLLTDILGYTNVFPFTTGKTP